MLSAGASRYICDCTSDCPDFGSSADRLMTAVLTCLRVLSSNLSSLRDHCHVELIRVLGSPVWNTVFANGTRSLS